ncbi:MAG TPA: hypothetical protein VKD90_20180 [Gemmataceae bacterium]|nr:hypothetical protein [Gemmataceae bacterium]
MVDPYDWLGIPKAQRPPTHYQLLGVSPGESDPAVIQDASDRRLETLLPHFEGPHADLADRLQHELAEARDTLTDPDRRQFYDTLTPEARPAPTPAPVKAEAPPAPVESPPAAKKPWWQDATPEEVPAAPGPWWKEGTPPDKPVAPPVRPIVPATAAWSEALPTRSKVRSTTAVPASPTSPPPAAPGVGVTRPPVSRGTPVIPILIGGLVIAGLIGAGVYFAFRPKPAEVPTNDGLVEGPKTDPRPRPDTHPGTPKADDANDDAVPADFVNQLRPKVFRGHTGAVNGIAVAKTGMRFATVGTDRTVRVWSVLKESGNVRHTFASPGAGVAYCDDDRRVAACDGLAVVLFDAAKSPTSRGLESPRGGVTALAVSPDGSRALTGLSDGYLRIWDTNLGRSDEWATAPRGPVTAIAMSPDRRYALSAVAESPVTLWDLANRNRVVEWSPHPGGAIAVSFSPDGKRAATGGPEGTASVYDLTTKKEIARLTGHAGPVTAVAWLSGGQQVVTASVDRTTRLWSADTGHALRWSRPLDGKGMCLAVDPADRFVLVGTSTGQVQLLPLPRVRAETLAAPVGKPPADPLPVPDPATVTAAMNPVYAELARDFAYNRPDDVALLADNLRRRAAVDGLPPALRFGFLREARVLAAKAADPVIAFQAVEEAAAWFDVDELLEKSATLAQFPTDADAHALLTVGLAAAERAETDARPEVLDPILKRLAKVDLSSLPPDVTGRLKAIRQRATAAADEFKKVRQAVGLLRLTPENQAANHTLGAYLCLARQDWARGLPHLVKGTDPRLIDAARADLAAPTDAKARHKVGETWYGLALDAKDHRHKRALLGRARMWFERVGRGKPDVADAIKAKARIDDVARLDVPSKDPATLPLLTPTVVRRGYNTLAVDVQKAEWQLGDGCESVPEGVRLAAGGPSMTSRFGLAPGGRLTLTIRPDGRDLRLFAAGQEVAFAGTGTAVRVVIERTETALSMTAVTDAGPANRTVELPEAFRGPSQVTLRLAGTPAKGDGAVLLSAIARGPVSLPLPLPE